MGRHKGDRQKEMDEYRDSSSNKRCSGSTSDYDAVKGLKSYIKDEMDLLLEDLMENMKSLLDQKLREHFKVSGI